ncbi:hypothetical protein WJN01_04930 [Flavobacteriaceae bacterium SZ-1-7]|uniref:hypothetical protein n=1 Tax=Tamlana sedimenti TaxID=3134126 RepID=UPI00312618DE
MPKKVRFAVYLIYIYLFVATIGFTFFDSNLKFIGLDLIFSTGLIRVPQILAFIIKIFIMGLLAFKVGQGKNWARITLLVLCILGVVINFFYSYFPLLIKLRVVNVMGFITSSVMLIAQLVIILLLFNKASNIWFDAKKEETNNKKIFTQNQLKLITTISLACLLIPFSIFGLWVYAASIGTSQPEAVDIFKNYFPDFLQGRYDTTILSIIFHVFAIILSGISLHKILDKFWKALNIATLVVSCFFLYLNIFSMM